VTKGGVTAIVLGLTMLGYVGVATLWGDPITSALAHRSQGALAIEFAGDLQARRRPSHVAEGHALGRILIPRIRLNAIFVEGTSRSDLEKGPGHYPNTALPGRGPTVAIAGHRTTWGAWFRHVDRLHAGDEVRLRLAYGTFVYRVTGQRVVAKNDWSILNNLGYRQLILSTCDPPYSASHRRIVLTRWLRQLKTPRNSVS
jgi:LPXTG-site transpeptidase (sortase) family protein